MKQYQIIYCDPPWWYSGRISRGPGTRTRFGNGAEGHYPLIVWIKTTHEAQRIRMEALAAQGVAHGRPGN